MLQFTTGMTEFQKILPVVANTVLSEPGIYYHFLPDTDEPLLGQPYYSYHLRHALRIGFTPEIARADIIEFIDQMEQAQRVRILAERGQGPQPQPGVFTDLDGVAGVVTTATFNTYRAIKNQRAQTMKQRREQPSQESWPQARERFIRSEFIHQIYQGIRALTLTLSANDEDRYGLSYPGRTNGLLGRDIRGGDLTLTDVVPKVD